MSWVKRRGRGTWENLTLLAGVTGSAAIRRDDDTVTFLTSGLTVGNAGNVNIASLTSNYLPVPDPVGMNGRQGVLVTASGEVRLVSVFAGNLRILGATAGATYAGTVTWRAGN
jgi:hypothetical protein